MKKEIVNPCRHALFALLLLSTFFEVRWASCEDTRILARIGEHVITDEQFRWFIEQLPLEQRASLLVDKNNREKVLHRMIDMKLVYLEAIRMGFDKHPDVIKKMEFAKEQIVLSQYIEDEINRKVSVSREAMGEFYRLNRDRFIVSHPIRIRHILLSTEKEAQKILKRLQSGEDFMVLAQNNSIDPSGKRGGDLGWLEKRVMDPDLARVAFHLNVGEISGVIRSQYGYHILRVEGKKDPEYKELSQVEDMVRERVVQQERKRRADEMRVRLRKDATISINENLLRTINIEPFDRGGKSR